MSGYSEQKGQKRQSEEDSAQLRWLEESVQRERDLRSENRALRTRIDHLDQELIQTKEDARIKIEEVERRTRKEIERREAEWDEDKNELLEDANNLMEEAKENQNAFRRRLAAAHEELTAVKSENSRLADEIQKIHLSKREQEVEEAPRSSESSAARESIQRDSEAVIRELRKALASANQELQRVSSQKVCFMDMRSLSRLSSSSRRAREDGHLLYVYWLSDRKSLKSMEFSKRSTHLWKISTKIYNGGYRRCWTMRARSPL